MFLLGVSPAHQFIYEGFFDKNNNLECEKIPLWEFYSEGFKMTLGHANLYYYLPFPDFSLCYRDPQVDNLKMTLLIRSLNMNENEANDCHTYASKAELF